MQRANPRLSFSRLAVALFGAALAIAACGAEEPHSAAAKLTRVPVPVPEATGPRPVVALEVSDFGTVQIELFADLAPKTVDNFLKLADEDFYVGTTFHRVIPEFAIQGGDPLSKDRDPRNDGAGDPGYVIEDEYSRIAHRRGIVSMANKGHPKTAGSQFFIVVKDQPNFDGKYAVFGRVIEGMDVVDKISVTPRDVYGRYGPPDRPRENVVIAGIEQISDGSAALAKNEEPTAGEDAP